MLYQQDLYRAPTDLYYVIFLLDVSTSMYGQKIDQLNQSMHDILAELKILSKESAIHTAVITFGSGVQIHVPLTNIQNLTWSNLTTSGVTPMGEAINQAKQMIEDPNFVKQTTFKPIIILISDGVPTDEWAKPLNAFISEGTSSKCDRHALAIGKDASKTSVLKSFAHPNQVFEVDDAKLIPKFFQFIKYTVTQSIQTNLSRVSQNPQAPISKIFTPTVSVFSSSNFPNIQPSYHHSQQSSQQPSQQPSQQSSQQSVFPFNIVSVTPSVQPQSFVEAKSFEFEVITDVSQNQSPSPIKQSSQVMTSIHIDYVTEHDKQKDANKNAEKSKDKSIQSFVFDVDTDNGDENL
jgi:uncharacterized protein YegL